MSDDDRIRNPATEDETIEAAVLRQLIALHPVQLTQAELVREVAGEEPDFSARDAVERAVRQLGIVGVVHRNGDLVVPSRVALRIDELLG